MIFWWKQKRQTSNLKYQNFTGCQMCLKVLIYALALSVNDITYFGHASQSALFKLRIKKKEKLRHNCITIFSSAFDKSVYFYTEG